MGVDDIIEFVDNSGFPPGSECDCGKGAYCPQYGDAFNGVEYDLGGEG